MECVLLRLLGALPLAYALLFRVRPRRARRRRRTSRFRRFVIRMKQALGWVPYLAALQNQSPADQISAHLEHLDLYALEGAGLVYVTGVSDNQDLADFRAGEITRQEFLSRLSVKVGNTEDLRERRNGYRRKCDKGQTHLWFWCFAVDRRCVGERLCHLEFESAGAARTRSECKGCHVKHREYWKYPALHSFAWIMSRMTRVFATLGQPGLAPTELEDFEIAFPSSQRLQ
ncbi:hypothetical protein C8F04DRAFT_1184325 [Mycena alexandri]|uniref:Bacteriophage T5 Orf172 DNA-binding domain-containing protein n=1 Tax=Mycena alexandri TaxID=1745969 RepID=A0AAD6STF8_9AGAR|nr:hypothetical protein C8F04DRAFT_1184325 [Mycena alexandri]